MNLHYLEILILWTMVISSWLNFTPSINKEEISSICSVLQHHVKYFYRGIGRHIQKYQTAPYTTIPPPALLTPPPPPTTNISVRSSRAFRKECEFCVRRTQMYCQPPSSVLEQQGHLLLTNFHVLFCMSLDPLQLGGVTQLTLANRCE